MAGNEVEDWFPTHPSTLLQPGLDETPAHVAPEPPVSSYDALGGGNDGVFPVCEERSLTWSTDGARERQNSCEAAENRGDGKAPAAAGVRDAGEDGQFGNSQENRSVQCLQDMTTAESEGNIESGMGEDASGTEPSGAEHERTPQDATNEQLDPANDCTKELPEGMRKGVIMLQCPSEAPRAYCDVYLVGTAHVSQESCREVQAVIRHLKPQVVFLELCRNRVSMLMPQNLQVPTLNEMLDMWRNKRMNAFGILYSWFLAKVADKLEVFPGSEFRIAYEEAVACGAKVILGDRDVQITLRRTWAKMNLWYKIKFIFSMVFQALFLPSAEELDRMLQEISDVDMLTLVVQEMSKSFPTLMETLLHERDMYMAAMLRRVAEHSSSVVAVVGKGHLSGIEKLWDKNISIDSLVEVPNRKLLLSTSFKRFGVIALAVGGIAIISSMYWTSSR